VVQISAITYQNEIAKFIALGHSNLPNVSPVTINSVDLTLPFISYCFKILTVLIELSVQKWHFPRCSAVVHMKLVFVIYIHAWRTHLHSVSDFLGWLPQYHLCGTCLKAPSPQMQAGSDHPANGLGWNGFNGLGFDMNCVWVDSNGLYYLMRWGGVGSM